jgi:tripartite-type tricarboxylate transporter receptor subunit TctC
MNRQTFLRQALFSAVSLGMGTGLARAQAFPNRPIKVVVPFNAGASVDTIARSVADLMSRKLGQPIIVDNKPGANAAIGAATVVSSPADGYTLFFASDSALVLNGLLYKKLQYDAVRDFTAVGLAANVPFVMVVNSALPVKNLAEFVAYGKQNPGKLNYSSTGVGGAFHLAAEMFAQRAGIDMTNIPFTGGGPATQALLAGQVSVMFGIVGSTLPHIRSGRLRALAVVMKERVDVLPGVPTLDESGYPGLEALVRYGMVVSKKTPPDVVAKLNEAMNFALADPKFRERFTAEGYLIPQPHKPEVFDHMLAADRVMWGQLIKSRGLTLD